MELINYNKLNVDEIDDILENESEYYSYDEISQLKDKLYYLLGYGAPIPKHIRCPKCDGITEIVDASCTFCGHKFCTDDYVECEDYYEPNEFDEYDENADYYESEKDDEPTELEKFIFYGNAYKIANIIAYVFVILLVILLIYLIYENYA